jgi:hypothetical protein
MYILKLGKVVMESDLKAWLNNVSIFFPETAEKFSNAYQENWTLL